VLPLLLPVVPLLEFPRELPELLPLPPLEDAPVLLEPEPLLVLAWLEPVVPPLLARPDDPPLEV
jgi:hypothetical protein